jgi:hypothetical protein
MNLTGMTLRMDELTPKPLLRLIGMELASVTFIRDCVQLGFDGPVLNALTPMVLTTNGTTVTSDDADFRNRLCERIEGRVTKIQLRPLESLAIRFADGSLVSLSLREEDYPGPEAIVFCANGDTAVF